MIERTSSVVILGGGPGGYEAALVAAQLGASVTVVDRDGLGGSSVLTDCVPSKALISTASFMTRLDDTRALGVHLEDPVSGHTSDPEVDDVAVADLPIINRRILDLASAQSADIQARLESEGVRILRGVGRLVGPLEVEATPADGGDPERLTADVVLVCTGATPGCCPPRCPTASASSRGSRSGTCPRSPSGSSSSAPVSPAPSWRTATSRSAPTSPSSPRASTCCPVRTRTPPRSSRTCSSDAA
ncbi:hypothetical protein GCM10025862_23980 [Arsenicicoccus piscis]|uniref:FAD/NAD(P)-binding domain-containing protein n=1 Tax=Arsenicicoccus piscis TaxID=673954 RepID=A0ABQ6HQD5_9MICO|nr:hypothetical protein GCM10025862_23980 [Arsenicicoccus piscis]